MNNDITDLGKDAYLYQPVKQLTIPILTDSNESLSILITDGDDKSLTYGICTNGATTRDELLDVMREAIGILERMPDTGTLDDLIEALGEDVTTI